MWLKTAFKKSSFFVEKKQVKWINWKKSVILQPDLAQMVELVDTLLWGGSGRIPVQVRLLFWAQKQKQKNGMNFNSLRFFIIPQYISPLIRSMIILIFIRACPLATLGVGLRLQVRRKELWIA